MEAAQGQICAGKDEDKRQKWRFWFCSYFMLAIVSSQRETVRHIMFVLSSKCIIQPLTFIYNFYSTASNFTSSQGPITM